MTGRSEDSIGPRWSEGGLGWAIGIGRASAGITRASAGKAAAAEWPQSMRHTSCQGVIEGRHLRQENFNVLAGNQARGRYGAP
jgi:hypothetical protein